MDEYSELDFEIVANAYSAIGIYYFVYSEFISVPFLPTELISGEYCREECQWASSCCALPTIILESFLRFQQDVDEEDLGKYVSLFSSGCKNKKIPSTRDVRMNPNIRQEIEGYSDDVSTFLGEIYVICILTNSYLKEDTTDDKEAESLKEVKRIFQNIIDKDIGEPENEALRHLKGKYQNDTMNEPWLRLIDDACVLYKAVLNVKRMSTFFPKQLVTVQDKKKKFLTEY